MFSRALACLLLAAAAWGQTTNPNPAPQASQPAASSTAPAQTGSQPTEAPKPAEVAPDAAVITVKGVCAGGAEAEKSPDCKTVITRAQFEDILKAIAPNGVPPMARKQLATRYAMAMAMADKAQQEGLDKTPRYEEMMKLSRMQVLSQLLNQSIQEKANAVSDPDIGDYYQKNQANYEEASLQRLFIPRSKTLPTPKVKPTAAQSKKQQTDAEAAMKTEAEALQKRAAAGGDMAKLQSEAYVFAGIKAKPPNVDMGKVRRTAIPAAHAFVMDLKTGEVSKLISDPGGYFVYKVGAKDTLPQDKVKEEIHTALRAQRAQASMQDLQKSAQPDLNDNYFMTPPPPKPDKDEDEDDD